MNAGVGTRLALTIIRFYKTVVAPWLPPACRFWPTCSEYASQAIQVHGFCRGSAKAVSRLLRCHPLHRGGYDPLT